MEKEKDGVWRTIRGRRIFIASGQSLGEAMSKSGKFNRSDIRETKAGLSQKDKFDRTISQSLKQRQKAIKDFRKKDTRYSNSVYTTDRKDEKNRINENAHIEGSGQTRVQRNWNKYSEADRREHRHELIQKQLENYKKINYDYSLADKSLKDVEKAKKELADFKARKQSNNKIKEDIKQIGDTDINSLRSLAKKVKDKQSNNKIDDDFNKHISENYGTIDALYEMRTGEKANSILDNSLRNNKEWQKIARETYENSKQSNNKVETEKELYERAKNNPDSIDPMTENSTDWEALEKKYGKQEETIKNYVEKKQSNTGHQKYSVDYWKKQGVEIKDNAPKGYIKLEGATTAPNGYEWYSNGKSRFTKEYKHILVRKGK